MAGFQVSGDLALTADETDVVLIDGADLARQQIRVGTSIWAGSIEWDLDVGLPDQTIFEKGVSESFLTQIFRQYILDSAGVVAVESISISLEGRALRVPFTARTEQGELVAGALDFA